MDTGPHFTEIRRLSLASSIVFLLLVAFFGLITAYQFEGLILRLIGLSLTVALYLPLIVAIAFALRLVYLKFTVKARISFVDGWLIHVSILILYACAHVAF